MEVIAPSIFSNTRWFAPITWPSSDRQPALLTASAKPTRDHHFFWLLFGIWVVNLFDLGFTLLAHQQRVLYELNPVVKCLLPYGSAAVGTYKFVLLVFGTLIIWRFRHTRIAWAAACLAGLASLAVALAWYHFYLTAEPIWGEIAVVNDLLPEPVIHTGSLSPIRPQ